MKKIYFLGIGLLALHVLILSNLGFTAWPEMFSFPYLINEGFLIYKDFHHAYQPFLTLVLSIVYGLFGYELLTLKIFTWVLILISDMLILAISVKLLGKRLVAAIPLLIFVLLGPLFEGNMLWFDLATVPLLLSSIYFLFSWLDSKRKRHLFWSGIFLGLSLLTKQQSIFFLPGYAALFWLKKAKLRDVVYFGLGGGLPIALTFLSFLSLGIFKDYLFWTFYFPLYHLPKIPGYAILPTSKQLLILGILLFPAVLAFANKPRKTETVFLAVSIIAAVAASLPRFSFFHLQPAVAIFSLLIGLAIVQSSKLWLFPPFLIFLLLFRQSLGAGPMPTRFYDEEAKKLAAIVSREVPSGEKVYLLGPHSLIYVLSQRVPPKPWIESYVWHFEIPGMQEKLIEGFEKDPPKLILWTEPKMGQWYDLATYQPVKIAGWIRENYVKEMKVENGVWLWRIK